MLVRYMLWPYVMPLANVHVAIPCSDYPISTIHYTRDFMNATGMPPLHCAGQGKCLPSAARVGHPCIIKWCVSKCP